jgi:RNA polymerase sigma-70 factor (ECF subfamily)
MDGRRSWEAGRAAWPGVEVTEADFTSHLDRQNHSLKDGEVHAAGGARLRVEDLYLACACARGDEAAIHAFERAFFDEIDGALARKGGAGVPPREEVRQLVRHKLFVAAPGARPKIAEYSGAGSLRGWFRVTVTRMILNLGMRAAPEIPVEDDALVHLLGGASDPELEYAKRQYEADFRAAFGEVMGTLTPRERTLLRYAFVEGLTVDAIGGLLRVHRATAARHVAAAHRAFAERFRARFGARLGLGEGELADVLELIHSRLHLSLERYLASTSTSRGP